MANQLFAASDDAAAYYKYADEILEPKFLEEVCPALGLNLTRNPEKSFDVTAVDFVFKNIGGYADLKNQCTPNFTRSQWAVSFNRGDYKKYNNMLEEGSDVLVIFQVDFVHGCSAVDYPNLKDWPYPTFRGVVAAKFSEIRDNVALLKLDPHHLNRDKVGSEQFNESHNYYLHLQDFTLLGRKDGEVWVKGDWTVEEKAARAAERALHIERITPEEW